MILSLFSRPVWAGAFIFLSLPAYSQTVPTRLQLVTASPTLIGQSVMMTAEVDALGAGPLPGSVSFGDGASALGSAQLVTRGANQETLAAGGIHTCALSSAGGVECWGHNSFGQLGDGTGISRFLAAPVVGLASGAIAVTAGGRHTCALTKSGAVRCWGANGSGQLGVGIFMSRSNIPLPVDGLASGVAAIAAGDEHTCALMLDGDVVCWGSNHSGAIGNVSGGIIYSPTAIAGREKYAALAAGRSHTCALTRTGGVKCWGDDSDGQIGDGTFFPVRDTPVDVHGLSSGVVAIAAGARHSCAVTAAGAVLCWGSNAAGQLGDGTLTARSIPVPVSGLASGVVAVTTGNGHTCALLSSGGVRCWGYNQQGEIGDGTTTDRLTPKTTAVGDVVGLASGSNHNCAHLLNGAVRCWGGNWNGQIGDGTITDRYLPTTAIGVATLLRARARLSTTKLIAGWRLLRASYAGDAGHGPSATILPHWVQ